MFFFGEKRWIPKKSASFFSGCLMQKWSAMMTRIPSVCLCNLFARHIRTKCKVWWYMLQTKFYKRVFTNAGVTSLTMKHHEWMNRKSRRSKRSKTDCSKSHNYNNHFASVTSQMLQLSERVKERWREGKKCTATSETTSPPPPTTATTT